MSIISISDISFIISTNRKNNYTISSIPPESEIIISTTSPLGQARNDGVDRSKNEWIVICDDDISFTPVFIDFLCHLVVDKKAIVGLEGYYPSPFVIGRFMLFHKSVFEAVGKFAIRKHGDETGCGLFLIRLCDYDAV